MAVLLHAPQRIGVAAAHHHARPGHRAGRLCVRGDAGSLRLLGADQLRISWRGWQAAPSASSVGSVAVPLEDVAASISRETVGSALSVCAERAALGAGALLAVRAFPPR